MCISITNGRPDNISRRSSSIVDDVTKSQLITTRGHQRLYGDRDSFSSSEIRICVFFDDYLCLVNFCDETRTWEAAVAVTSAF